MRAVASALHSTCPSHRSSINHNITLLGFNTSKSQVSKRLCLWVPAHYRDISRLGSSNRCPLITIMAISRRMGAIAPLQLAPCHQAVRRRVCSPLRMQWSQATPAQALWTRTSSESSRSRMGSSFAMNSVHR